MPASEVRQNGDGILSVQPRATEDSSLLVRDEEAGVPSQGLVPPTVGQQYGTFARSTRSGRSTPNATSRTQTPAPTDGQDTTRVGVLRST